MGKAAKKRANIEHRLRLKEYDHMLGQLDTMSREGEHQMYSRDGSLVMRGIKYSREKWASILERYDRS